MLVWLSNVHSTATLHEPMVQPSPISYLAHKQNGGVWEWVHWMVTPDQTKPCVLHNT